MIGIEDCQRADGSYATRTCDASGTYPGPYVDGTGVTNGTWIIATEPVSGSIYVGGEYFGLYEEEVKMKEIERMTAKAIRKLTDRQVDEFFNIKEKADWKERLAIWQLAQFVSESGLMEDLGYERPTDED